MMNQNNCGLPQTQPMCERLSSSERTSVYSPVDDAILSRRFGIDCIEVFWNVPRLSLRKYGRQSK
jgi:hypothetical protein